MRGAFVVQLGPKTRPTEGQFEGWVEEVDSGKELRFHSTEELLAFLGQRFAATDGGSELYWRNRYFRGEPEDP
jgi:hypothetical protein